METIIKTLKSRTFWTIVVMFLIGGVEAVSSAIPEDIHTPLLFVLGALATFFKVRPSQTY